MLKTIAFLLAVFCTCAVMAQDPDYRVEYMKNFLKNKEEFRLEKYNPTDSFEKRKKSVITVRKDRIISKAGISLALDSLKMRMVVKQDSLVYNLDEGVRNIYFLKILLPKNANDIFFTKEQFHVELVKNTKGEMLNFSEIEMAELSNKGLIQESYFEGEENMFALKVYLRKAIKPAEEIIVSIKAKVTEHSKTIYKTYPISDTSTIYNVGQDQIKIMNYKADKVLYRSTPNGKGPTAFAWFFFTDKENNSFSGYSNVGTNIETYEMLLRTKFEPSDKDLIEMHTYLMKVKGKFKGQVFLSDLTGPVGHIVIAESFDRFDVDHSIVTKIKIME